MRPRLWLLPLFLLCIAADPSSKKGDAPQKEALAEQPAPTQKAKPAEKALPEQPAPTPPKPPEKAIEQKVEPQPRRMPAQAPSQLEAKKPPEKPVRPAPRLLPKPAPSVASAAPNDVQLVPGAAARTAVKLSGNGFDRLRGAEVRVGSRPATGVRATLRAAGDENATLELSAESGAAAAAGLTVQLVGDGLRIDVPLRVAVQPPEPTPRTAAPRAPSKAPTSAGSLPAGSKLPEPVRGARPEQPGGKAEAPPLAAPGGRPGAAGTGMTGRPRRQVLGGLIVRVEDESGNAPVAGADVCLGTESLPVAYGMRQTDGRGDAHFPNAPPNVDLRVIVAKQGYEGRFDDVDYDPPDPDDVEDCPPFGIQAGQPFDPDEVGDCEVFDRDTVEIERGDGGPTCPPTERGSLRVRVADGAGAAVCIGGPGGVSEYGARLLGASGEALFADLPLASPIHVLIDRAGNARVEDTLLLNDPDETERSYSLLAGRGGQVSVENGACVEPIHQAAPPPPPTLARDDTPEAGPEERAVYTPSPVELFSEARSRGYVFRSDENFGVFGPSVNCPVQADTLAIDHPGYFMAGLFAVSCCDVHMFEGPDLQPGWSMSVRLDPVDPPDDFDLDIPQRWSQERGGNPGFVVRMCKSLAGRVDLPWRVIFSGPAGRDWREAITP